MTPVARIVAAIATVLGIALGAWQGAIAQKEAAAAAPMARLSNIFAPLFPADSRLSQAHETIADESETAEPRDDSTVQQPKVSETPEIGEDNSVRHHDDAASDANDDHRQAAHDQHGEVTGIVTAIDGSTVTINGQTYQVSADTENISALHVGAMVTIEFVTNSDGSVAVREVKTGDVSSSTSDDANQAGEDSAGHHRRGSGSDGGEDGGGSGGGDGSGGGGGG